MSLDNILNERLEKRKAENLFRDLKQNVAPIDFCSNDYLGLSRSRELNQLIEHNYNTLPVSNGATGSRLLSGNSAYVEQLEHELAGIFNGEAALIFNSGYSANMSVLSSIPQKGDTIIYDELAHACIKDGARLSHATRFSFRHNDLNDLEKKITKSTGKIYIVAESIYSMDGDQCPLSELVALSKKYDATIILDEAHSTGTYGINGSGLSTALHLEDDISIRICTFGKAIGVHGACVIGSRHVKQYLINFARQFIYTTALPLHSLVSISSSFQYLKEHLNLQGRLHERIATYLSMTAAIDAKTQSRSAIQTIITPGNTNAKTAAQQLQKAGFDVRPILSPTVPAGTERLRICLHTFNSENELKQLSELLLNITTSSPIKV